jgi:hypothetical protein
MNLVKFTQYFNLHLHDSILNSLLAAAHGLSDEQKAFQKMAFNFAANEMSPHMADWDEKVLLYSATCLAIPFQPIHVNGINGTVSHIWKLPV